MKYLIGLVILFLGFATQTNVLGCTCGGQTVCQAYANADAIVIAEVTKIITPSLMIELPTELAGLPEFKKYDEHLIELKIEKTYKGKSKTNMILSQPGSLCDWQFDEKNVGKKYLFYLNKNSGAETYTVAGCGRSGEIIRKSEDLYWLNDLKKSLKRTRVSGNVRVYKNDRYLTLLDLLSNVPVKLSDGNKIFTTKSDLNGVYQFWDIPYGRYKITPSFEDKYTLRFSIKMGNISWKFFPNDKVDNDNSEVIIDNKSKCGGEDYILNHRNEKDIP